MKSHLLIALLLSSTQRTSTAQNLRATVKLQRDILSEQEQELLAKELAWAEKSMEAYKQQYQQMPLRSPIRAVHVHSKDWKQDSLDLLQPMHS